MKKNILVASDSFKGSLKSKEICEIWKEKSECFKDRLSCVCYPFADGGEGSLDSFLCCGGRLEYMTIKDPVLNERNVSYVVDKNTMVIESAAVIGLPLLKQHLNPMKLNTVSLGNLIRAGIDKGYTNFLLFLGGSATTDGGIGLAEALGYRFLDRDHEILEAVPANLKKIEKIDMSQVDNRLAQCSFTIATDVFNPLTGKDGCARVFGPQKGASLEQTFQLDEGLTHLADLVEDMTHLSLKNVSGLGAAGGLGLFLYAFHHAEIKCGAAMLMERLNLEQEIQKADLIISGEGHFDEQSLNGKLISYLLEKAKKVGVPVWIITGASEFHKGESSVDRIILLSEENTSLEEKMSSAYRNYSQRVSEIIAEIIEM